MKTNLSKSLVDLATRLYDRLGVLKHPVTRYLLAGGWTLLVTVTLVQSSSQPVVGPPAPPGAPDLEREILLTLGHIVAFSVLTALWWWALIPRRPEPRALFVAVGFALILGFITEIAQTFVADRGASFYDVMVNWTVTIATATAISSRWRKNSLERLRQHTQSPPI